MVINAVLVAPFGLVLVPAMKASTKFPAIIAMCGLRWALTCYRIQTLQFFVTTVTTVAVAFTVTRFPIAVVIAVMVAACTRPFQAAAAASRRRHALFRRAAASRRRHAVFRRVALEVEPDDHKDEQIAWRRRPKGRFFGRTLFLISESGDGDTTTER